MNGICPICLESMSGDEAHAQCRRELYGSDTAPVLDVALSDIERRAVESVNRSFSVTGVQRKLSVSYLGESGTPRLTVMGALGGTHILKPPSHEYPGMPELEHWSMRLAAKVGIRVAHCGLIPLASGEMAYVTRRFDREGGRRVHVEDFCQLSEQPTNDKYRSSMEKVGALARRWATVPGEEALRVFGATVFCLLTANSDMHLKNWSLLRQGKRLALSPAYDLLPTRLLTDDPEEFALPINGRKAQIARRDLLTLAKHMRLPDSVASRQLDWLRDAVPRAMEDRPSPWVRNDQVEWLKTYARKMSDRLGIA